MQHAKMLRVGCNKNANGMDSNRAWCKMYKILISKSSSEFDVKILFLVHASAVFLIFANSQSHVCFFDVSNVFDLNFSQFLHSPPRLKVEHAFKAKM